MRSIEPDDYQHIPRPVAVLARMYASGESTGRHTHLRGQLLYAIQGLMVATTEGGTWAVPIGHALLIPPGLPHDVTMHGRVAMRTAYLDQESFSPALMQSCRVIQVSPLLGAALCALADDPVLYDMQGRGPHLAAIVLHEVIHAPKTPFALPLPVNVRLRKLCQTLIDKPSLSRSIDAWADEIGMSRRTFTRRFRDEIGLSFGEWCRRLRILNTLMLQAEGKPFKEAARSVGYGSPQALKIMMKRVTKKPHKPDMSR